MTSPGCAAQAVRLHATENAGEPVAANSRHAIHHSKKVRFLDLP